MMSQNVVNALSIDLEDWYQVSDFNCIIKLSEWSSYESRLRQNAEKILQLLDRQHVRATFFVLTWNAEKEPGLVKEIHAAGHEIGSHGHGHQLIYQQQVSEFEEDVKRSVHLLENLTGEKVRGYRAPSFSITTRSLWALEILMRQGLEYDSSIFPISRSLYGIPLAERFPHVIRQHAGRQLIEFPISTIRLGKWNVPFSGGAYLRALPVTAIAAGLRRINKLGQPAIVYFHPWELDPGQPKLKRPRHLRPTMHYIGLNATESKLEYLLSRFKFGPIREVISVVPGSDQGAANASQLSRLTS
jgi:polysaccharide deacetylase family protein (PEP-CTERM system associated)